MVIGFEGIITMQLHIFLFQLETVIGINTWPMNAAASYNQTFPFSTCSRAVLA